MEGGEVGGSRQDGSRRDWWLQARLSTPGKAALGKIGDFRQDRWLQARLATPDEIVCMAVARGRQSRLRMREEEKESEEGEMKAYRRESFRDVR